MDEDDDVSYRCPFERGHWHWDDRTKQLEFVSDISSENVSYVLAAPNVYAPITFKEDVDLMDQQRFKKMYQRKLFPGEVDVVSIQDVIDCVLFTTPLHVLSAEVVKIFHIMAARRFLRALIFFTQYFLQVSDEMTKRSIELKSKIPSLNSHVVEEEYRENIEDLRLLVAKEYYNLILGVGAMGKFHHMSASKKFRSLMHKDAHTSELLLRISTQIVWIALGRRSRTEIEIELHRLFKTDIYNNAAHTYGILCGSSLPADQHSVLVEYTPSRREMLTAVSPLIREIEKDKFDYRMFGIGVIKFPKLNSRLKYYERMMIAPEESFQENNFSLGIVGLQRERFDTMLRPLAVTDKSNTSSTSKTAVSRKASHASKLSAKSRDSTSKVPGQCSYPRIVIPPKTQRRESVQEKFPEHLFADKSADQEQYTRWMKRIARHKKPNLKKKS